MSAKVSTDEKNDPLKNKFESEVTTTTTIYNDDASKAEIFPLQNAGTAEIALLLVVEQKKFMVIEKRLSKSE